MSLSTRTLDALVATLPAATRERYREEWRADLAGAASQGIGAWQILRGALGVAVGIDRVDPANSGLTVAALAARRARWGLALLAIAALLVFGTWLTGGWIGGPASQVALIVGAGFGTAGLWVAGSAAALALGGPRWRRRLVLIAAAPVLLLVAAFGMSAMVLVMMAMSFAGVVAAALLPATRPLPHDRRGVGALAVGSALAMLAVAGAGVAHVLVWNPLAKVPGRTLEQIYAAMAAAGESPGWGVLAIWAGGAVASALAVLLVAWLPARTLRARATRRRILGIGLTGIAGTGLSVWVAGFSMGMGIADTFATSGGDAALTGPALLLLGVLAGIPAVLLTVAPPPVRATVHESPA